MNRRSTIGVTLAGALTVVVVAAVWRFGVIPTPAFEALSAKPDPSIEGTIAYLREHDDGERTCAAVVAASGGPVREEACDDSYRPLAFDASGHVLVGNQASDRAGYPDLEDETVVVDAEGCWDDDPELRVVKQRSDGSTELVLFSGRAPRDYCFEEIVVSPDGRWYATIDSDGRLLVGAVDRPGLRVLADRATSTRPVWYQGGSRWESTG